MSLESIFRDACVGMIIIRWQCVQQGVFCSIVPLKLMGGQASTLIFKMLPVQTIWSHPKSLAVFSNGGGCNLSNALPGLRTLHASGTAKARGHCG